MQKSARRAQVFSVVTAALVWAAAAVLPARAQQSYTFTTIADSSGPFRLFSLGPSINNAGTVAFHATLAAGGEGIYTGSGEGLLTPIADTSSGYFAQFGPTPSLNDSGVVAFRAFLGSGGQGIFTGNGAAFSLIADTSSGRFSAFGDSSINNAGAVAFVADLEADRRGIFAARGDGAGGDPVSIVETGSNILSPPDLNDLGTLVFRGVLDGAELDGIYTASIHGGGPITTIIDTTDSRFVAFGSPVINNAGTVVYRAFLSLDPKALSEGIFRGAGGDTIVDSSGRFSTFTPPAINDQGMVVFRALLKPGSGIAGGIFSGPDLLADKIIAQGDPLAGSTVTSLSFLRDGLNDHGQIAFFATLEDGRQGIFRADPRAVAAVIPEPGTLALLLSGGLAGGGAAALGLRRRPVRRG